MKTTKIPPNIDTIEKFKIWVFDRIPHNKRNNMVCYSFSDDGGDRVRYLFNACGTSKGVGSCKFENLNKMFDFEDNFD